MNELNLKVIEGEKKILLSAPHCVEHTRENSTRPAETKTKAIVKALASSQKTYGVYKTKDEYNDANWDKECTYKSKVVELVNEENIKSLIDFHGMAAHREQDICIGVNDGKNVYGYDNLIGSMVRIFKEYGIKNVTVDDPFAARHEYCVSTYTATKCSIPTFQIEINCRYTLSKYEEYNKYGDLVEALEKIVELIEDKVM